MHIIARHTLWSVYKEYHLDSVHTRRDRLQQRRGGWTCPGPNYSWSIDGYRKLAPYGFEIYAGIDAYSRFIPWFYVGVCSGTAWNVFAQYINVVANGGYLPLLLSADRGSETPLVAGAHYYLSAAVRDGPSPVQRQRPSNPLEQDGTGLHFKDCFVYCKSLRNIKIESWWDKMNRGRAIVWRVSLYLFYFINLFRFFSSALFKRVYMIPINDFIVLQPSSSGCLGSIMIYPNLYECGTQNVFADNVNVHISSAVNHTVFTLLLILNMLKIVAFNLIKNVFNYYSTFLYKMELI